MQSRSARAVQTPKCLEPITASLLLISTGVEIVAIAHHPHVQVRDLSLATREIVAAASLAGWIHGIAIGCLFLIAYCLGEIVRGRVPAYLSRAAALVYGGGLAALITAATVDGWVLERLAASLPHASPTDLDSNARFFQLCMAWVTASTNLGMVMTSTGLLIASAGLLRKGRPWQIAGTLGLVADALLAVGILTGHLTMDGHGARVAVGLQGISGVGLAIAALRTTWREPARGTPGGPHSGTGAGSTD